MRDKDSEIFEFDAQLLSVPEPFFLERDRVSVQENLQTLSVWNHLWVAWLFPIQGEAKPPCFKLLNRCNFQKLHLKSQLMTENCGFWLDFLVSNNGFVLELCTSLLGKKKPNNERHWIENKSSSKASNTLSSSTMHWDWVSPPTPRGLWFGFTTFIQSPEILCIYLWR